MISISRSHTKFEPTGKSSQAQYEFRFDKIISWLFRGLAVQSPPGLKSVIGLNIRAC